MMFHIYLFLNIKMLKKTNSTLILPISGGYCVNQMSVIIQLQKVGYIPKVICGSSGGALAALLANNSDWYNNSELFENEFYKVTNEIDSTYYTKPINILLNGLMFAKTALDMSKSLLPESECKTDFNKFINFSFEKQPELWINTYCVGTNKENLWCTKSFDNYSYVKHETDLIGCDKNFFQINSIEELFEITRASVSLPAIVPAVVLRDGQKHYDAGIISPSPFNSLKFRYLPANKDLKFNVIYVAPTNYSLQKERFTKDNTFSNLAEGFRDVIYGLCVGDIQGCLNMLFLDKKLEYYTGNTLCELQCAVELIQSNVSKSFLLIYPGQDICLNILNMKKGDATNLIQKSSDYGFILHHWYVLK
jgi:hypothetical protein